MVITYHGKNYFKISSGELSILVDPLNQRSYKGTSVVLFTEKNLEESVESEIPVIDHAGEFEIGGIHISGWQVEGDEKKIKTVYRIMCDEISLAVFGGITKELPTNFSEYFEEIDIAFAPIGGKPMITIPYISKFLRQIEPGLIIPAFSDSEKNLKEFFKEFGGDYASCDEKFVVKKKDITPQAMRVQCLKGE